jgi:hypothetical protein
MVRMWMEAFFGDVCKMRYVLYCSVIYNWRAGGEKTKIKEREKKKEEIWRETDELRVNFLKKLGFEKGILTYGC